MDEHHMQSLAIAGVAGAGLALYHTCCNHKQMEFFLHNHDSRVYTVHKFTYIMLWSAFFFNARAAVVGVLKMVA